jgi:hypothetical protein
MLRAVSFPTRYLEEVCWKLCSRFFDLDPAGCWNEVTLRGTGVKTADGYLYN